MLGCLLVCLLASLLACLLQEHNTPSEPPPVVAPLKVAILYGAYHIEDLQVCLLVRKTLQSSNLFHAGMFVGQKVVSFAPLVYTNDIAFIITTSPVFLLFTICQAKLQTLGLRRRMTPMSLAHANSPHAATATATATTTATATGVDVATTVATTAAGVDVGVNRGDKAMDTTTPSSSMSPSSSSSLPVSQLTAWTMPDPNPSPSPSASHSNQALTSATTMMSSHSLPTTAQTTASFSLQAVALAGVLAYLSLGAARD